MPIIPGLKPISTKKQLNVLPDKFHCNLPETLIKEVVKCKDNLQVKEVGIEWCIKQSKELKEHGVPFLHYYSMGKALNIKKIAQTRSLKEENILVSSGSSSLMFSLFPQLINEESKVLILSPMYGEYLHILTHLIGCNVTHFPLYPDEGFEIDKEGLISISREHDAVILVNPNSPTGVYCEGMEGIIRGLSLIHI